MKIVACASFDYMKLMVVELQQQLAELEEAERAAAAAATATAAASAVADEADAEPKPPPRQRANPFNNQVHLKSYQDVLSFIYRVSREYRVIHLL